MKNKADSIMVSATTESRANRLAWPVPGLCHDRLDAFTLTARRAAKCSPFSGPRGDEGVRRQGVTVARITPQCCPGRSCMSTHNIQIFTIIQNHFFKKQNDVLYNYNETAQHFSHAIFCEREHVN